MILLCAIAMLLQGCGGGSTPVPSLVSIKISPTTAILPLAGKRQLQATGVYTDGTQLDISQQVTWGVTVPAGSTGSVTVTPAGMVTGVAPGLSAVTASMGSVIGLLQLNVNTNGFKSSAMGVLVVPLKAAFVDAVYLPLSNAPGPAGRYVVQELNLDADSSSSVFPVQTAVVGSVAMPAGFVPNATAASQTSLKVAVISYASPNIVIIDASNDPNDLLSNTVVATYTSPVTQTASFGTRQCMICAGVVNPINDQLILSTAQGYYTLDMGSGTFKSVPFSPTAFPALSFALNPVAASPYIISPTYGQDPHASSEVQILDLTNNTTTSYPNWGLTAANQPAIDLFTNTALITDAGADGQTLLNIADSSSPIPTPLSNLGTCSPQVGSNPNFDMAVVGVGVSASVNANPHDVLVSQSQGGCVGIEVWLPTAASGAVDPGLIPFGFAPMPSEPDGSAFLNGPDPNAIATYTSVVDKGTWAFLVDANQSWLAKINMPAAVSFANLGQGGPLPAGQTIPLLAVPAGTPVVFLPTTGTFSLSATEIDFGTQTVGTAATPSSIILTNAGTIATQATIAVSGANASDFNQSNTCATPVSPGGTCSITITFTPSATGARAATLNVTGGGRPLSVALTGTGD
jgi:hypothetical protein